MVRDYMISIQRKSNLISIIWNLLNFAILRTDLSFPGILQSRINDRLMGVNPWKNAESEKLNLPNSTGKKYQY
jgi:hypothetical protein